MKQDKRPKVLCVTAHPDDESLMAGVILTAIAERGAATHIVCATRGEDGHLGDPPVCRREELGAVREGELRCAAAELGVSSVEVFGYVNSSYVIGSPELTAFDADPSEFEERILNACARLRPNIVLTHGSQGDYGHPGHVLVHQTVVRAHQMLQRRREPTPALYTFAAMVPGRRLKHHNAADPADLVWEVEPWMDKKTAAIECHRTQHALFFTTFPKARSMRDIGLAHGDTESLHRVWVPKGFDEQAVFGDVLVFPKS